MPYEFHLEVYYKSNICKGLYLMEHIHARMKYIYSAINLRGVVPYYEYIILATRPNGNLHSRNQLPETCPTLPYLVPSDRISPATSPFIGIWSVQ